VNDRIFSKISLVAIALMMAGCGGAGPSSLPAAQSPTVQAPSTNEQVQSEAAAMQPHPAVLDTSPATASATPAPIVVHYGGIVGLDNTFSPVDGDTSSGGNGSTIDGVPCDNSKIPYHFHAHVSLLINGQRLAIPDAIGLHYPGTEKNGQTFATICYYHIHTHDATGLIHIEASAKTTFRLGQLFAVWGKPLSSSNVAGHGGTVKAFIATARTPGYAEKTGPFSPYTGNLQQLQFTSHQEIVLEVGPTYVYPPNIPAIVFPTYQ